MARRNLKLVDPKPSGSALDGDADTQYVEPVVVEDIDTDAEEVHLAADNLLGHLVRWISDRIKGMDKPWSQMSEKDQQTLLDDIRYDGQKVVIEMARTVAAKGRKLVFGAMEQVTIKDEIKAVITCQKSPEAAAAFGMSSGGGQVALVLMQTESLLQEVNPVKPDPDQWEIPLEEDAPQEENTDRPQDTTTTACPL
jgi:hypothetical protein